MTMNEILSIGIKNGRFVTLHVRSEKTKGPKNNKRTIVKDYYVNGRYGVHYFNMQSIKEKRDVENVEGNRKPMWFKHTENKSFVVNREDESRMYLQIVNPKISRITYWEGGEQVAAEKLLEDGFLREDVEKEMRPILTLNLDNIQSITYDQKVYKEN